jgi:hypothetical protein
MTLAILKRLTWVVALAAAVAVPVAAAASASTGLGTPLTTHTQAMDGNLQVHQGSTLSVGYDFTMPGNHPQAAVRFLGTTGSGAADSATATFTATCASGSQGSRTIEVDIFDHSYNDPANSTAWYPSGDQNDTSTYQGSVTVPSFCTSGALVSLQQGGTFSTNVSSTDTQDKVDLRWHYEDGTGGGWSGSYGVVPSVVAAPVCSVTNIGSNLVYPMLQAADNEAAEGDTLTVQNTCTGPTTISQNNLTIEGVGPNPTLNGNGAGSVLHLGPSTDPGAVVAISNLMITNGNAPDGGGVSVEGAVVTLTNVQISGNTDLGAGGGLYVNGPIGDPVGAGVTCTSCTITENNGDYGGGAAVVNSSLTLKSSTVQGNHATIEGGGLYLFGGTTPPFPAVVRAASTTLRSAAIAQPDAPVAGYVCANGVIVLGLNPCPSTVLEVTSTVINNTAPSGSNLSNNGGTVTADSASTTDVTVNDLYWADTNAGTIENYYFGPNPMIVGGVGPTQIASGQNRPTGVAVDLLNNHLYWANEGSAPNSGTIVEANSDGSNQKTIATGQDNPVGVAVSGNNLYWANGGDPGQSDGSIIEANFDGTDAHAIATNQDDPSDVAVGGTDLVWSNYTGGTIVEANLDGTDAHTIATNQDDPNGVAIGGGVVYWTSLSGSGGSNSGTVVEANLDGTVQTTLATGSTNDPAGIAVIPIVSAPLPVLFWANFEDGTVVVYAPAAGGARASTIASGQDGPNGPAVGP